MLVRPALMGAERGWGYSFGSFCWVVLRLGHCLGYAQLHIYLQAMLPQTLWPPGPACHLHLAPLSSPASAVARPLAVTPAAP